MVSVALAALMLIPASSHAASGAAPITVPFDHLSTGFELDGVHRDLPCESCHLNAVFRATPRDCGTCHITGSPFNATPKTQTHIPSTNNCAACHNTISFRPDVHFDHKEVMGSCVSCHNGTIAQGEGPTHPATSQDCAACHTVMSWNPPKTVDHSQIPLAVAGFCIICHNGVQFSGKPKGHLVTSLECGDCHTTVSWLGADFDHTGIRTGCSSCHNGTKAVGKPGNHMPTTDTCEDCHTTGIGTKTPSWVPSLFNHTQMTVTTCETCHSGKVKISTGYVSGQPANHVPPIPSAIDCGVCHGNNPSAETWTVLAASIATLHTGLPVSNCLQCHAGETFAGVPAPYVPMSVSGVSPTKKTPLSPPHIPILQGSDCISCHGAAYQAGGFGPATAMSAAKHAFVSTSCDTCHDTGKSFYVGAGTPLQLRPADHVSSTDPAMATGDCSQCHETKDWVSTTMPAGHMPNPASLPCSQCHVSAPSDYTPATLAAYAVLHTGITGNCGLCHGNTTTALTWFNSFTPKDAMLTPSHIPYLSGSDCSSCHAKNYVAGGFGPMNMTQATHAFVPTACATCHEAGLSFYLGAANPALQGRPADHTQGQQVAPNDCSLCHTTANWMSTVLPAGHMPNPANQACTVCHTAAPTNYTALAGIATLHTGITGGCAQCHGANTQLTFYNNTDNPKDGVLTPSHIPYLAGTDCGSCHAQNYVAGGFGPMNMTQATHAFVPTACVTCHEAGLSLYMGAANPALQGRPADHTQGQQVAPNDCSLCHTTANWVSTVLPTGHMPNPGNQACTVCHTAAPASYTALAGIATLHTGITGGCAQCHGANTQLTFYNNTDNPKDGVLTPSHIPYLAGTDCGSCHAQNYVAGGFGPMNMTQATHAFVPTACVTCHEAGLSLYMGAANPALQGRPADHTQGQQVAPNDCSLCHTTANWNSGVMPAGHMPNPANQACAVCHTAAPGDYVTLASVAVLHTGISGNCGQCHGAFTQLAFYNNNDNPKDNVLTPAHIPYLTGSDCSNCHAANFAVGGFGPTGMSAAKHAFVPTTCDTCHEAGLNFYMGASTPALQGRPLDHMAPNGTPQQQTGDCSGCHETTDWNSTALPAGHMPNPGGQQCTVCHTAAPGNYATLASNAVLHTGITTGCAQCHGGSAPLTFYNNNDNPKSGVLTPPHIPAFSGTDCSNCHTSTTYAAGSFGPMNMTQATHSALGSTGCANCHEAGLSFFMGAASPGLQGRPADHTQGQQVAPNDCSLCHTTANWSTTVLPSGHMPNPASQTCNTCHTAAPANYAALASVAVLHTGITGACGQCHGNGSQLSFYNNNDNPKDNVLTPAHIPYLAGTDCGSCHAQNYAAGGFGPMNMTQGTHAFVVSTCATCHEAGLSFYMGAASPALQGRPADHTQGQQVAPNDCSLCHTTANWNSTVMPAGHMPNPANQACSVCHTAAPTNYTTLAANAVLHTGITSSECAQCHGGTTPLTWYNNFTPKDAVLAPSHIPFLSGTSCGSCHSSATYAVGGFGPMNMTQATHNFVATTCVTCHEAGLSFYMGAASPALQGRPADHTQGQQVAPNDCSLCHTTANWNSTAMPAGHMPNPANQSCTLCHTAAPTNYTTLAANAVLHTGITSSECAQCHGGTTPLTWYNNFTPKDAVLAPSHIPFLSGTSCGSCHSSTTYAVGGFGPMNMTQATHAFVVTTCVTCHEAGLSFYMGAASPALQGRPADHTAGQMVAPNDCSICHTTANWNSTVMPAGHMPNPANQACTVCHTAAPTNYATLAANAVLHTGITSGCITCHGAPNATPPVFYLNYTPKDAVLSPVHIPTSTTPCEDCHAISFTAFSGTSMSSAKHTSMFAVIGNSCLSCHELTSPKLSFYGVTNLTVRPSANHHAGQNCGSGGCHNTNNWDGGAAAKKAAAKTGTVSAISAVIRAPATGTRAVGAAPALAANPTGAAAGLSAAALGLSHAGVTTNCVSCHNGLLAAGKPGNHIASNETCENCHTTSAWLPARFEHQGINASCSSCHNGVQASGKPVKHLQTTQDCGACHGTITWAAATFDHTGANASCRSCHNGITATGKQPQHPITTLDCGACHGTLSWIPTTVAPAPRRGAPSNPHATNLGSNK